MEEKKEKLKSAAGKIRTVDLGKKSSTLTTEPQPEGGKAHDFPLWLGIVVSVLDF